VAERWSGDRSHCTRGCGVFVPQIASRPPAWAPSELSCQYRSGDVKRERGFPPWASDLVGAVRWFLL